MNAIERVHNSALVSYNDEQWRQLSAELERLQSDTRKQNAEIKRRLTGKGQSYSLVFDYCLTQEKTKLLKGQRLDSRTSRMCRSARHRQVEKQGSSIESG